MHDLKDPLWPKPPRPLAGPGQSTPGLSPHTCPPNLNVGGAGILNLLAIVYALRPRLRSRLTLGGRTFPRKPWVYGGQEFNLSYRYSCLHSLLGPLHRGFRHGFDAATMLPYQWGGTDPAAFQSFGRTLIANHFRRGNTR